MTAPPLLRSHAWRLAVFAALLVLGLASPARAADTTPPATPTVTDDGATTTSTTSLHATWKATDPESGIAEYRYQIRRDGPSGATVADWTSTGTATSGTKTLTLQPGVAYYFAVKAKNGAGLWSALGYSNGITVQSSDTTPPAISAMSTSGVTASAATATWTTNEAATSQVEYGATTSYGSLTSLDAALVTAHSVSLSGLVASSIYHYRVRSKDAAGNEAVSSDASFTTAAAAASAFQESGGQVVIEAEHFDGAVARGGKSWVADAARTGFSGVGSMTALPNSGTGIDTGYATTSPELQYRVNFATTGTYYVWIRGAAANGNDDSLHAGLDGAAPASADRISGAAFVPGFGWVNGTIDNAPATVTVSAAGVHTLNLWMREDGLSVDRILLRTNSSATPPAGSGPAESPRTGALLVTALIASPAARAYAEDGMTFSVAAMGPNPIEYQVLIDGAVARGWSASPSYAWPAPIGAIGRHTVQGQARDAQTTPVTITRDVYVIHKPVGAPQ